MKILFTSIGRRVELVQHFRQAAERINVQLMIYGADMDKTAPAMMFCDERVIVPRIKSAEYIPCLVDVCRKEQIDLLVPTIDTDLLLLAERKAEIEATGTRVLISAPDKIRICRDKRYTADYFHSVGLKSPSPVDDYQQYDGGFPAFIKPKDGSSSIFAYKVHDEEELISLAKQVPDYIIQPFASGTEYTVDVFCDFDGNPIYITPRIRLAVRAGEVLKTKICQDEQIISEVKQLLKDYQPCGPITLQLIKDNDTGTDNYIEINPRFGGGAPISMMAGADSAEALIRLVRGESLSFCPGAAEDGAVFSRFDQTVRVN